MANDLLKKVVSLLGLEIGEKFKLRDIEKDIVVPNLYYFSEADGLMRINANGEVLTSPYVVNSILSGKYKIIKLPWEPKKGKRYYFPRVDAYLKGEMVVGDYTWDFETFDLAMKALGMVYRTKEEAEAHFASDYEKLTGKPLSSCQVDNK